MPLFPRVKSHSHLIRKSHPLRFYSVRRPSFTGTSNVAFHNRVSLQLLRVGHPAKSVNSDLDLKQEFFILEQRGCPCSTTIMTSTYDEMLHLNQNARIDHSRAVEKDHSSIVSIKLITVSQKKSNRSLPTGTANWCLTFSSFENLIVSELEKLRSIKAALTLLFTV